MANTKFKHLLAGVICAVAIASGAQADVPLPLTSTQEYRLWSAEQMIKRLSEMTARTISACNDHADRFPRLSAKCTTETTAAHPEIITAIRKIAASGNDVQWAKIIDIFHKLEAEIAANLPALERR